MGKFLDAFKKFWTNLAFFPKTEDELRSEFPHKTDCSERKVLKQLEEESYEVLSMDLWTGPSYFKVNRKYLECPECKAKQEYVSP